jgi:hypothetical protein
MLSSQCRVARQEILRCRKGYPHSTFTAIAGARLELQSMKAVATGLAANGEQCL